MSKKRFTEEERKKMATNRYIRRVSDKAITYADEFKQLFIDQYMTGKTPREIFVAHGFDVSSIGIKRVENNQQTVKKKPLGVLCYGSYRRMKSLPSRKQESGCLNCK